MELDATFWALIALVIFLGIVVYLKVPGQIGKALDARADKIRHELEEARKLREEAQELLAEYQRKRKAAEAEASDIVAAARHEADLLAKEARKKTEDFVARRTAMAEQKIGQAEAQAMADVRSAAVDIAIAASQKLIAQKASGAGADALFKQGLAELKSRMN